MFTATRGDARRPRGQRDLLVQADERVERRDRMARGALDLGRARPVAEHVGVRRRAVDQPERDARVHRVHERALPLDPEQAAAAPSALDDELLGRAGEEIGDDGVDGDPPARDRDAGLAGGHEHRLEPAPARSAVELERDGHLPDRAVGADGEHDVRVDLEVGAGRDAQPGGRPAQVAQLDAVRRRQARELGVEGQELVQAVLDVETGGDRVAQQHAPLGREAAALRRDADERRRRRVAPARP